MYGQALLKGAAGVAGLPFVGVGLQPGELHVRVLGQVHGRAFFVFRFVAVGSYFEVDTVSTPPYGERNEGAHETHRLSSDRGGKRICFGDPSAINTLQIAYEFAAAWAENTWKYINTGERF